MQTGNLGAPRAPAIRLGDVCHHVLDFLVATNALRREQWDVELGRQWQEEIDHERALQTADDLVRWGPPPHCGRLQKWVGGGRGHASDDSSL